MTNSRPGSAAAREPWRGLLEPAHLAVGASAAIQITEQRAHPIKAPACVVDARPQRLAN